MPSDDRSDRTLDLAAAGLATDPLAPETLANDPPANHPPASDPPASDPPASDLLAERIHAASGGLAHLIARADAVQRERVAAAKERGAPRWTDVFTTQFTEFSNRPR